MSRIARTLTSRRASRILTFALCVNVGGCFANDKTLPTDWRTECVGRMELELPGDAETQSDSIDSLGARGLWIARRSESNTGFSFDDDVRGWTELTEGPVWAISPPLTADQMAKMRKWKEERRLKLIKDFKGQTSPVGRRYDFSLIPTPDKSMRAEHQVINFNYDIELGDRVVEGRYPINVDDSASNVRLAAQVFAATRPRKLFELPQAFGLCYPHVFVKDDTAVRRKIGVDYRSKARPDFHVVLWDATAYNPDKEGIAPGDETARRNTWRNKEPDAQINFFWGQRQLEGATRPEWLTGTKRVEMDGRAGLQSFIRLERSNGTVDHEYYAVVRGDPKAKEDTPDLWLYVYTSNDYGKKKGLTPISKDEFIKMAQAVAASVKRRPVTGK